MEGQFKQCPNGHYYEVSLDQCPYCPIEKQSNNKLYKVCANGHCYGQHLTMCPYCDDKRVVCSFDPDHTIGCIPIHITENEENKGVGNEEKNIPIIVNDRVIEDYKGVFVVVSVSRGYKLSYEIVIDNLSNNGRLTIKPDDKMSIGRTALTGKEFVKLCDIVINNNLIIK